MIERKLMAIAGMDPPLRRLVVWVGTHALVDE
jgi:hypothetical protein